MSADEDGQMLEGRVDTWSNDSTRVAKDSTPIARVRVRVRVVRWQEPAPGRRHSQWQQGLA